MATAVEENKSKLDTDAEGAPSIAAADPKLTTAEAAGEAIATDEEITGADVAAEALLPKIDSDVAEAEVKAVHESNTAAETQARLDGTDVMASGPHIPTENLGSSNVIQIDSRKSQASNHEDIFPPVMSTKGLGQGDGTEAANLENHKIGLFAKLRGKILGGKKAA